ncbi:23S rRNA (guanosine(2251)-2'-O)-methyltransferase RlmB [soil metagenome]
MQEIIYGIRPVIEALRSKRREVREILDASGSDEVRSAALQHGIEIKKTPRDRVDELAGGGIHQEVVARVSPYPYSGLDEILAAEDPLIIILDGVTDPRNLGAVLRVAEAAGASGVVIPKDKAVGVTAAAVKASAGASEQVRVARETNLRRAIDRMKKAGLWLYAAESVGSRFGDVDLAGPVGLVLGSEGRGVRRLVREGCDGTVSIPMLGSVESLNVSVAAAVLLFEVRRQRGWP